MGPLTCPSVRVRSGLTAQLADARQRLAELIEAEAPGAPLTVLDFRELNTFFVQTVQMFDTIFGR